MTTDRLTLYNIALEAAGERFISSLTEPREPRRLLDHVWTRGKGAVRYFLEQGHWNHAMRAVQLDKSPSVTPEFGWANAFDKPDDFVRLNMISSDDRFGYPLNEYEFEGDFIYADVDPLYLRYVSDDDQYGSDMGKWPDTFTLWAGHWMATQIAGRLKNDIDAEALKKEANRLLIDARSKDASQEPVRWPPLSSWAQARLGRGGMYDRGLRNKLIGS